MLTAVYLLMGVLLSFASATLPQICWGEESPLPQCTRAWPAGEGKIGVVLADNLSWWLPIDRERSFVQGGKLLLNPENVELGPQHFRGPLVQFTEYDTYALPVNPLDVKTTPPDWVIRLRSKFANFKVEGCFRSAGGWPVRCFEGFSVSLPGTPGVIAPAPSHSYGLTSLRLKGFGQYDTLEIPYLPIPHALLINTLFWGTLFAGFIWLCRRIIRRLLNLLQPGPTFCHHCRYPRTGLRPNDPCPECGQAPSPINPSISA